MVFIDQLIYWYLLYGSCQRVSQDGLLMYLSELSSKPQKEAPIGGRGPYGHRTLAGRENKGRLIA